MPGFFGVEGVEGAKNVSSLSSKEGAAGCSFVVKASNFYENEKDKS